MVVVVVVLVAAHRANRRLDAAVLLRRKHAEQPILSRLEPRLARDLAILLPLICRVIVVVVFIFVFVVLLFVDALLYESPRRKPG